MNTRSRRRYYSPHSVSSKFKTKMHTKKYIDNLLKNAIYGNPFIQLTAEDVQNCKLSLNKNQHNTQKEDCNKLKENDNFYKDVNTSIDDKTTNDVIMTKADVTYNNNYSSIEGDPANKKQKLETNGTDILKLVLSRESEILKFKSQFKSPLKTNKEITTTSTKEVSLEESESEKSSENTQKEDCNKLKENDNFYKDVNTSIDDKTTKDVTMTKADITYNNNYSSIEDPANKKQKLETNGTDILKLVLSRESEILKFKSQFKSPLKTNKEITTTSTKEVLLEESESEKSSENTQKEDCNKLKENDNFYKDVNTSIDDKTTKDVTMTKADITYNNNYSSIEDPANKKQKLETNGTDILKLVLSRESEILKFKSQFKSPLKTNKEITTTSTTEVSLEESIESQSQNLKSSEKNVKSMIRVIDPRKMMKEDDYKIWMKNNPFGIEQKHVQTEIKKVSVAKLSTTRFQPSLHSNKVNGVKQALNSKNLVRANLIKIEKLYIKYFSKCVQDTVVIIANILNIISISNKYYENRINESYKKRFEAEKLKGICDADQLHGKHKRILQTKLKNNFICVISSFAESEFDLAFQIFFLSILTVLQVLDQPKFGKGGIFKNVVHLLSNSLKNCEFNHQFKQKMFSMFRSKTFQPECINLISIIEDSRDTDPGITDRMTLFFVSTVYSRTFFQPVIKAVTCDSNDDLELLIDNANFQCCINSKFKDPVDSSTLLHPNNKIPVPETIQRPINSDVTTQNRFLANNPDKTNQQMPVSNSDTAVEPTSSTSQPLNNFYKPLSYSLQKKTSESSTSLGIPTKKCIVVKPATSNSSLVQVTSPFSGTATTSTPTTFVTFNPSIQKNKSVINSQLHRAIGGIILIDNKQYKLVQAPLGQMRAGVNGSNILVTSPSIVIIKCHAKNCNNSVTIMCSVCKIVKYCSYACQGRDWYDNHRDVCRPLNIGP